MTEKNIKKYTEEELKERLKQMEKEAKPRLTTAAFVKALSTLDRIRRNTDMIILLLHTLFCVSCGAILALGVYIDHPWLKAGGGLTGIVSFVTLLLTWLNPKGDLSQFLNRDDFLEQLNKLSQKDFKRLYEKMNETGFLPQ